MECVNLREDILKECLGVDLVDDGSVVHSDLRVMSFVCSFRLFDIVYVGRYVKSWIGLLYVWWLHLIIFKFLLIRSVGLILIDILISLFNVGQILIDFINLNIMVLFICNWIMRHAVRLSNLLVSRLRHELLQFRDKMSEFEFAFL